MSRCSRSLLGPENLEDGDRCGGIEIIRITMMESIQHHVADQGDLGGAYVIQQRPQPLEGSSALLDLIHRLCVMMHANDVC